MGSEFDKRSSGVGFCSEYNQSQLYLIGMKQFCVLVLTHQKSSWPKTLLEASPPTLPLPDRSSR